MLRFLYFNDLSLIGALHVAGGCVIRSSSS